MKRILSALFAALMCVIMLAACNTGSAQVQTPSTDSALKDVALSDVLDEINARYFDGGENMKLIESADKLELYYSIAPEDVAEFAAEVSKNSATEIDEVVLVKAVDAGAAERVADCLELRLQSQKDLCASYSPELLAIAEKCAVTTNDCYVALIVTENYSEVSDLYNELLFG